MVKLELDPSLHGQRYLIAPCARRGFQGLSQSQNPSAISRAIMARAFSITSSPEVSIWP